MKLLRSGYFLIVIFLAHSSSAQSGMQETPIRLSFSYGSLCCPRDPEPGKEIKSKFEVVSDYYKEKKIKMRGGYIVAYGDEGEYEAYFTLNELSEPQRNELVARIIENYKPDVPAAEKEERNKQFMNMMAHPPELRTLLKSYLAKPDENLERFRIKQK